MSEDIIVFKSGMYDLTLPNNPASIKVLKDVLDSMQLIKTEQPKKKQD